MALHQILRQTDTMRHWDPTVQKFKELLARNWDCTLKHTYREGNMCADAMAASFYQLPNGLHVFENPPPEVALSLLADRMGITRLRVV